MTRWLFFKEAFAWPRASGHDVHTYYLMRSLAARGDAVSLATLDEPPAEAVAGTDYARRFVLRTMPDAPASVTISDTKSQAKFRGYWGIDAELTRRLAVAADSCQADAVVVSGLNVLPYLGAIRERKRVWYAADEWGWHHWSQVKLLSRGTWGELKQGLVKTLYERAYRKSLDAVWAVSDADARAFRWLAGTRQTAVVPNGVDADHYRPLGVEAAANSCVFWGRLDFGPNIQAVEHFMANIWPLVRKQVPDAAFHVYGFQPTGAVRRFAGRDGCDADRRRARHPPRRAGRTSGRAAVRERRRHQEQALRSRGDGDAGRRQPARRDRAGRHAAADVRRLAAGVRRRPGAILGRRRDAGQGRGGQPRLRPDAPHLGRRGVACGRLDRHTGGPGVNKFLLVVGLTFGGCLGGLLRGPFVPVLVYYGFVVLRPQALWRFQLDQYANLGWSFYLACAALVSYLPWVFGGVGAADDPERRVFPKFTWSHRLMMMFGLWMTLSYLNANDNGRAWQSYEEFLKIWVMYALSTQVIRSFRQIHLLYIVATLSLAYLAFEIVQIYLMTGYLVLVKRGFAGQDNNGAALLLAMGLPLCFFAWEMTRGWYRWAFLLMMPVIGEAVLSSYSRGAMVSAAAAAPFYLLYTRKRKFVLVCFALTAVAVPFVAGKEIKERFLTTLNANDDESFQSRNLSRGIAIAIANDYPVFGAGIRCSGLEMLSRGGDMENRTVHNQYLQIAADEGWVGLAWYMLFLGAAFTAMWRARRRLWREPDPECVRAVAMLGGIECALITFFVGAMALSMETFELPYLLLLIGTQVWSIVNAQVAVPPRPVARQQLFAGPAPRRGVTQARPAGRV